MRKFLPKIIMMIALISCVVDAKATSLESNADNSFYTAVEQWEQIVIIATESTVQIKNAEGQVLEIFDMTGQKVAVIKIDSDSKTITLNDMKKGCYILRIGKTVRKIYIK